MCAYNVRKNKRVDNDPASGGDRTTNRVREIGIWVVGLTTMYLVYWLARRFLF